MDLLDLLEVNKDRLPSDTQRAASYIERAWLEARRPTEPEALAHFLDGRLRFCSENGFRYPRVLLLRLKQLQRGEWSPRTL